MLRIRIAAIYHLFIKRRLKIIEPRYAASTRDLLTQNGRNAAQRAQYMSPFGAIFRRKKNP